MPRPLRGDPGKRVQPFQAYVACRHAERPRVVFGKPRQRLLVAAVAHIVHQFIGAGVVHTVLHVLLHIRVFRRMKRTVLALSG